MRMSSPKTFRRYRIGKGCHGVRALPLASLHPCVSDAFDRTFSRELAEKRIEGYSPYCFCVHTKGTNERENLR